jgi:hypothetical protein
MSLASHSPRRRKVAVCGLLLVTCQRDAVYGQGVCVVCCMCG